MKVVSSTEWAYNGSGASGGCFYRRALAKLGAGLRGLYKDVTEEPVPESLAEFVRKLERRERLSAESTR